MAVVVEYKYIPDQMPAEELKRTFAARRGLLDHVLNHLRGQVQAQSLSSFLLIGPRGAGKTTLVLMLCGSIRDDPELAAAWLPLRFREEQFGVCSLRDLLAAAVQSLAEEGVSRADRWSARIEGAADDEESQSLAVAALRDVARSQGKRLILFVENLNLLLGRAFNDTSQATLRRLLMVDPFLMLIGTAVQTFEQVEGYDQALFNYFHPLHLEKLDDEQMFDLLQRRAEYDQNTAFLERLGEHRPKLRALARVTGGNPRFILMVYEILSEGGVTDAVQVLERLVDQLTPVLKHVLEELPPQQAKIVDALMRAGGTATPAALAQVTRLKLNAVTSQLRRLKDNRMVEVLGGGKGQTANYTVPDQLFCTWYQMRYLQRKRRRIELFVEVIRVWFEAEERLEHVRRLAGRASAGDARQARSFAESAEYFTAALRDTDLEDDAKRLMIQTWLCAGDVAEAALALANLSPALGSREMECLGTFSELQTFCDWCGGHDILPEAVEAARRAAEERQGDWKAQLAYALCVLQTGDFCAFRDKIASTLALLEPDSVVRVPLLIYRGVVNFALHGYEAAMDDFAAALQPRTGVAVLSWKQSFPLLLEWSITDYSSAITRCERLIGSRQSEPEVLNWLIGIRDDALGCTTVTLGSRSDNDVTAELNRVATLDSLRHRIGEALAYTLHAALCIAGVQSGARFVDDWLRAWEPARAENRVGPVINVAKLIARPEMRPFWPVLVRRVHEKLPPESAEAVAFLLPVADVLEGKGLAVLDPLPPQERAFALEVLKRFEAS